MRKNLELDRKVNAILRELGRKSRIYSGDEIGEFDIDRFASRGSGGGGGPFLPPPPPPTLPIPDTPPASPRKVSLADVTSIPVKLGPIKIRPPGYSATDEFIETAYQIRKSMPTGATITDEPREPSTTTTTTTTTTTPPMLPKQMTRPTNATPVPVELKVTEDDLFANNDPMKGVFKAEAVADILTEADRIGAIRGVITEALEPGGELNYPTITGYLATQNMDTSRHNYLTRADVGYDRATSRFVMGEAHIDKKDLATGKLRVHHGTATTNIADNVSPLTLALMFVPNDNLKEIDTGSGKNVFVELQRIFDKYGSEDGLLARLDEMKAEAEKKTGTGKKMAEKVVGARKADVKLLHDPAVKAAIVQYGTILGLSGILDKKVSGKPPAKFALVKRYEADIRKEIAVKKEEMKRMRTVMKTADSVGYKDMVIMLQSYGVEVGALEKLIKSLNS